MHGCMLRARLTEHLEDRPSCACLLQRARLDAPLITTVRGRVRRGTAECRPTDDHSDEGVQHRDDGHRCDEEQEGGRLERVTQVAVSSYVTGDRLRDGRARLVVDVHQSELDDHRHGADGRDDPQQDDHLDRPP